MKKWAMTLIVALCAGFATAGEQKDLSIAELKAAIEAKTVTLLDANGTASWKAGHVPGAVDFTAAKDKLADLLPKDKDALVVAYCGGPQCGAYKTAVKAAAELGYTNVRHLSAGIKGWKAAGEKVEKGE